jgi:5-methylcytosine-specific restriction endonuclease McrA
MPTINRKTISVTTPARTIKIQQNAPEKDLRYSTKAWRSYSIERRSSNPVCGHCGRLYPMNQLVVDHVIPVSFGGSFFDHRNHMVLCAVCHNKKTATEKKRSRIKSRYNEHKELIPCKS